MGSILGREDPLEKGMANHSIFLPGGSHGKRRLTSYIPWGCKESDTSERLSMHARCYVIFLQVSAAARGILSCGM